MVMDVLRSVRYCVVVKLTLALSFVLATSVMWFDRLRLLGILGTRADELLYCSAE